MMGEIWRDLNSLAEAVAGQPLSCRRKRAALMARVLANDSFAVLVIWRARRKAARLRLPIVGSMLRRVQTTLFGVEIDQRAHLGEGVWMVHPVGTVVGGDSEVGDRVRLMGGNTVGTNTDDGYPRIEKDVVVGVGAKILGPVRVGAGARIGAGAVVLSNVPPGALALGMPARIRPGRYKITRSKGVES